MKLIFNKNTEGNIEINITKGTTVVPFDYIVMLKQLMIKNDFEDTDFGNLQETEIEKIKQLLEQIQSVVNESINTNLENTPDVSVITA